MPTGEVTPPPILVAKNPLPKATSRMKPSLDHQHDDREGHAEARSFACTGFEIGVIENGVAVVTAMGSTPLTFCAPAAGLAGEPAVGIVGGRAVFVKPSHGRARPSQKPGVGGGGALRNRLKASESRLHFLCKGIWEARYDRK